MWENSGASFREGSPQNWPLGVPQGHCCEWFLFPPEGSKTGQSSSLINLTWRPSVHKTGSFSLLFSLPPHVLSTQVVNTPLRGSEVKSNHSVERAQS